MGIEENLQQVRGRIVTACAKANRDPGEVTLVAVTKTVPAGPILEAFSAGVRHFGENRVQEAETKLPALKLAAPEGTWHMIGHLQTNKASRALELFHCIDSVDSIKLAKLLDEHASKRTPILVQVNVSGEMSKEGFSVAELPEAISQIRHLAKIEIRGLMTIAPLSSYPELVRPIFRRLRELRDTLGLRELSMGMSEDYMVAVEEGSTMVRVGRAIFGERKQ